MAPFQKGRNPRAKKVKSKETFAEKAAQNRKDLEAIRKSRDKKSRAQVVSGIIFTVAMTVLIITLVLSYGNMKEIGDAFIEIANGSNWVNLLIAFFLTIGYFIFWPFSLVSYNDALSIKSDFWDTYAIADSEHFYNDVTPSYSGGQPFQIYAMKSVGVDTSKATGSVLATFVTYLMVTNLIALGALIFTPYYLQGVDSSSIKVFQWTVTPVAFIWITAIGYFMNLLTLLMAILLGTNKKICGWIISAALWLTKFKWLGKIIRKQLPVFIRYCRNTQNAFKEIVTHKKHFLVAFLARLITMCFYYAIPFFLLQAVGVKFENAALGFWVVFFGTSFAITAVCWLPTPGSTGGIEIAFTIVMSSLTYVPGLVSPQSSIGGNAALAVSLLWRFFTYYFILFLSLGVSIAFQIRVQRRFRREVKELSTLEVSKKNNPGFEIEVDGEKEEVIDNPEDKDKNHD